MGLEGSDIANSATERTRYLESPGEGNGFSNSSGRMVYFVKLDETVLRSHITAADLQYTITIEAQHIHARIHLVSAVSFRGIAGDLPVMITSSHGGERLRQANQFEFLQDLQRMMYVDHKLCTGDPTGQMHWS
jgi:hypothetical protein